MSNSMHEMAGRFQTHNSTTPFIFVHKKRSGREIAISTKLEWMKTYNRAKLERRRSSLRAKGTSTLKSDKYTRKIKWNRSH